MKLAADSLNFRLSSPIALICLALLVVGCGKNASEDSTASSTAESADSEPQVSVDKSDDSSQQEEVSMEFDVEKLLAARLPSAEAASGWIRLFDGQTLMGWQKRGAANFRVEDGAIVVDGGGDPELLCTTLPWKDFELVLEFQADEDTNSGVFLRTPFEPSDPASDCYEVNIAPDDNPFPTAGVVKRLNAEMPPTQAFGTWRTMEMRLEGDRLSVKVDGQLVTEYTDPNPLDAGHIGLQYNSGRVAFREIKLRPLSMKSLLDKSLSQWTAYPEMPGSFTTTDEGWMHVQGGRTQLESKELFGDFVLLAEYKLPTAEMNSGIFFRCIPGAEMMGYECQLSNEMIDGDHAQPADHGTGGIFRRQEARIVAGEVDQWTPVVLVAHGSTIAAWVSGVQVSEWVDDRDPDENPRRGRRTEAGSIMIQGHDPGTNAFLKQIMIDKL